MYDSSLIELSKSALTQNLRFLKKEIGKDVRISSVIKGNAYGHGIKPFVPLAEKCGVNHFSVFDANEAFQVRQCQTKSDTQIMIMGFIDNEGLEWTIENDISFYVFDLTRLEQAKNIARRIGVPARIHLQLETGMNRTGLKGEDVVKAVEQIKTSPNELKVKGVSTHYAGAESIANYKRIQDQIAEFHRLCNEIEGMGLQIPLRQETEMQYVLHKNSESRKQYSDPLRRVLRWSSKVMHITSVGAGEFVGYGTSYITLRPQKIAIVPVGYSHGFRRSLSNLGRVLIRGKRANVIGLVNMSMMMVDISSIPSVEIGDEVVIIGKQKNARITVGSFSDMANLINYEMLVRLPSDIPRVITN